MADLYDSFVRLTWDPGGVALVLVDFGDPLWGPVMLDGQQVVQITKPVRAIGIKAFPRGNEQHAVDFELCRIEDTMADAFAARINATLALPRNMKDLLISLEDGRQWRLTNCAVESWPGSQEERLTREKISITGGSLSQDFGTYPSGNKWSNTTYGWENLGATGSWETIGQRWEQLG